MAEEHRAPPEAALNITINEQGALTAELSGYWVVGAVIPPASEIERAIDDHGSVCSAGVDASGLKEWDSALLTFLLAGRTIVDQRKIDIDATGLPEGARRLLKLASAIPEKQGARREQQRHGLRSRVGSAFIVWGHSQRDLLEFTGELALTMLDFVRGRARFRPVDLWEAVEECGARSLPIVTLISVLIGLILAFVGAMQLSMFGAQIYVADLVGLGTVREMAPLMAGIIMAGRVGSAHAARLGTMQVNEEIDAYTTLGLSPMSFLVLPRVLALAAMMPLLCLYADFLGILGGAAASIGAFDVTPLEYWMETRSAVGIDSVAIGVVKSFIFGLLIAVAGCMSGIRCGRSALAVGAATTEAVVKAIVWIIVADSVFAIITTLAGI